MNCYKEFSSNQISIKIVDRALLFREVHSHTLKPKMTADRNIVSTVWLVRIILLPSI